MLIGICTLIAAFTACGSSTPGVQVSGLTFNYGDVAIGTQVRRIVITVKNTTKADVTLAPTLSGGSDFTLGTTVSCGTTLPAMSSCSMVATFAPSAEGSQTSVLDLGMASNDERIPLTGNGVTLAPGQSIVSATDNPQVARYTYAPVGSGAVGVQFGLDTNYGLQTSVQNTAAGTPAMFLVAGMQANSTYHMQATVAASDGSIVETDSDQTFSTSSFPADTLPSIKVTTTGTPQPGIELMNPASAPSSSTYLQAYAVDLQGNLIWGYDYADRQTLSVINPVKLLPNGDMLMAIGINSLLVTGPPAPGELAVVREVDLAGVPVRQITLPQINSALSAAGFSLTLLDFHHDIVALPNGHWLVLGNLLQNVNGLPGSSGATAVLGDAVVDLDENGVPVWVWNEFDHLDVTRAPAGYPDWTHSNALLYVAGDGNLLVSSRHMSWVMKVDYRNGAGTGNVLWRLGYQGDFRLVNGTEPQDWFYGQHQPSFIGSSTTGTFSMTMMDNGFTRQLSPGNPCSGASCYSTVPVFSIDENAKTATIQWRDTFPNADYSIWGGGTTALANGDVEFDLCAEPNASSEVDEVVPTNPTQVVWSLTTSGQNLYRSNRIPSLYPGVQW